MDPLLAILLIVAAVLLAAPLFAISTKLSRSDRGKPDAAAERAFESELRDVDSGAGR